MRELISIVSIVFLISSFTSEISNDFSPPNSNDYYYLAHEKGKSQLLYFESDSTFRVLIPDKISCWNWQGYQGNYGVNADTVFFQIRSYFTAENNYSETENFLVKRNLNLDRISNSKNMFEHYKLKKSKRAKIWKFIEKNKYKSRH